MLHSIIPPSSASIWGKPDGCTGWVLMSQQYPETEVLQDALDGEASHEIGSTLIYNPSLTWSDFNGKKASNGVLFDEEMFDAAKIYADNVIKVLLLLTTGRSIKAIEKRIDIKYIHDLCFGTPDCYVYNQATGDLYIWDYKFGHDIVEAFENWQLLVYLCGILDRLGINGSIDQFVTVHMVIVQPRAFHRDGAIREWVTSASKLRAYFNILHDNAHKALSNDSVIRSGPHCKNCSARHACPAALRAGLQLYEVAQQPLALELSPEALGLQYLIVKRAIKQLECIETGLKAQVEGLLKRGELVPYWMFENGKGKKIWTKPIDDVIAMGNTQGKDLRKKLDVITPIQAIAKGVDENIVNQYSKRIGTGLQLTPDNGNKAKRLFS